MPRDEAPPELPEPAVGINFARVGLDRMEWISFVAKHSDSWLKALAIYFGARFGLVKNEREKLFQMINNLPTIFEVVKREPKERSHHSKSSSSKKMARKSEQHKSAKRLNEVERKEEQEVDAENSINLCGACGKDYDDDYTKEFWIFCDMCGRWLHGKCVKITPERATHINKYMCPNCATNKG